MVGDRGDREMRKSKDRLYINYPTLLYAYSVNRKKRREQEKREQNKNEVSINN